DWKKKFCEIDIISQKNERLYFSEVKYCIDGSRGGGLAAITKVKYKRMEFAARIYLQAQNLQDIDCVLCAATVSGSDYKVDDFIEL
ncbi:YraN family protein, partial [Candidatus Saccharibacteria bacterium]|nr:YraN family protein [Candidatus Saccharibacteria bacterium]